MDTSRMVDLAEAKGVRLNDRGTSLYFKCAVFTIFVGTWFLASKKRGGQWEFFTTVVGGISRAEVYCALSKILDDASAAKEVLLVAKRDLKEALSAFVEQSGTPEHQLTHPHISRSAVPVERLN